MVARYALLLLLAACATSGGRPASTVRGCWIDRTPEATTTMRWLPDRGSPRALIGESMIYTPQGAAQGARYRLEQRGEGWVLCRLDAADDACWPVSGAPSGPLAPGRVAVQGSGEHLHITRIADDIVEDIFVGRRDGCD